ncbi:hypothetical protein BGW80DRAFT_1343347 [Lactifluus volemus]|nr:hypothetical protein BGW80DRAFT_1343347 [Lactifluus volemus]
MKTSPGSVVCHGLLALGIVFHFVYVGTIFDCHFTSPVVHGMRQYKLSQAQANASSHNWCKFNFYSTIVVPEVN